MSSTHHHKPSLNGLVGTTRPTIPPSTVDVDLKITGCLGRSKFYTNLMLSRRLHNMQSNQALITGIIAISTSGKAR